MAGNFTLNLYRNVSNSLLESSYVPDYWTSGVAPSITSKSGTYTAGNTLTLTGTNFSRKNTSQSFFTDFTEDTLGQRASGFYYWTDPSQIPYLVDSNSPSPIGSRHLTVNPTTGQMIKPIHFQYATDQNEIFLEYWVKIDKQLWFHPTWSLITAYTTGQYVSMIKPTDAAVKTNFRALSNNTNLPPYNPDGTVNSGTWYQEASPQVKLERIVADVNENSMQNINPSISVTTEALEDNIIITPIPPQQGWYGLGSNNVWTKHTVWYKKGTYGLSDGKRMIKIGANNKYTYSGYPAGHMASPSGSVSENDYDGDGLPINDSPTSAGLRRVVMPYFKRAYQSDKLDIAHVFINDSPERVVIGDASTWATCDHTKSFVCKTLTRDNTQITFKAAESTQLAGNLYAYVWNRDNLVNSTGYQVR